MWVYKLWYIIVEPFPIWSINKSILKYSAHFIDPKSCKRVGRLTTNRSDHQDFLNDSWYISKVKDIVESRRSRFQILCYHCIYFDCWVNTCFLEFLHDIHEPIFEKLSKNRTKNCLQNQLATSRHSKYVKMLNKSRSRQISTAAWRYYTSNYFFIFNIFSRQLSSIIKSSSINK